ncbi:MAG: TIM barrel protein [Flavobacteriaceae bacterium]|nr:TIM barrel protein [Flavobacteriaceae bacterium]
MKTQDSRRKALKHIALGTGALAVSPWMQARQSETQKTVGKNINHSVCYWCYEPMPLDEFAEKAKDTGISSIELLRPDQWNTVEKHRLTCAVATDTFASITDGFNDPKNHNRLQDSYKNLIVQAAEKGLPNVIVFSGNKRGMADEVARENCAKGLDPLVKLAEKHKVTLIMELLNSKVNHPDYQCDTTPWGVALSEKIGSENFKLLYDIYHMQIMEGDVIATIRKYHKYIAHYHTGGVPGRNEINHTQELNYPAIMRAITETGFKGFVAQEFIPTYEDKIAALKEGVLICDV